MLDAVRRALTGVSFAYPEVRGHDHAPGERSRRARNHAGAHQPVRTQNLGANLARPGSGLWMAKRAPPIISSTRR